MTKPRKLIPGVNRLSQIYIVNVCCTSVSQILMTSEFSHWKDQDSDLTIDKEMCSVVC